VLGCVVDVVVKSVVVEELVVVGTEVVVVAGCVVVVLVVVEGVRVVVEVTSSGWQRPTMLPKTVPSATQVNPAQQHSVGKGIGATSTQG